MTVPGTTPPATPKEMAADLQRLIDAIDRRIPHADRLAEAAIARDATDLRDRAVALMAALTAAERG